MRRTEHSPIEPSVITVFDGMPSTNFTDHWLLSGCAGCVVKDMVAVVVRSNHFYKGA